MTDLTTSANVDSLLGAANYAAFKALLSLGNVDNTADAGKPISTATLDALTTSMTAARVVALADAGNPASDVPNGSLYISGGVLKFRNLAGAEYTVAVA